MFVALCPQLDGWAPIILEIFSRGTKENTPHFFFSFKTKSHIVVQKRKDWKGYANSWKQFFPDPPQLHLPLPVGWRTSELGSVRQSGEKARGSSAECGRGNGPANRLCWLGPVSILLFLSYLQNPNFIRVPFPQACFLCSKAWPCDTLLGNQISAKNQELPTKYFISWLGRHLFLLPYLNAQLQIPSVQQPVCNHEAASQQAKIG